MKNTKLKIFTIVAIISLMFLFSNFQTDDINGETIRWHVSAPTFSLNPSSFFPDGIYYQNFANALNQWNAENNFLQFQINSSPCIGWGTSCDVPVSWSHNGCDAWSGITQLIDVSDADGITYAEMHFDADCSWVPNKPDSENNYAGNPMSFRQVALHEIGHTLYLGHDFHALGIMNYFTNFERLMPDDLEGLDYVYPSTIVNKTDLSVSTMHASNDDLYARPNGLDYSWYNDTARQIQFEYTLLNNGTTDANNVMVKFYLQNEQGDQYFLDSSYFDLPARSEGTFSRTVDVVFNSVPSGDYKLWVKVDSDNSFVESSESNNALPCIPTIHLVQNGLYTQGSVSDSMLLVNQAFTYNAQACNYSTENHVFDVHVLGFSSPNLYIQSPSEVVISHINPNQCQNVTFQVHAISNNPTDEFGDYVGSMITSFNSPDSLVFGLNASFNQVSIFGYSMPNVGYELGTNLVPSIEKMLQDTYIKSIIQTKESK